MIREKCISMPKNKSKSSKKSNTFWDNVGESLLNNKGSIFGAILIVMGLSQFLKFAAPDYLFWGIPMTVLVIGLMTWLKKVGWADLGFIRPKSWRKTIGLAFLAFLIVQVIGFLQYTLTPAAPDFSTYEEGMTLLSLLGWVAISWTTAAFGEEIIYRGFILKQVTRLFGEQNRWSWGVGLVVSSIIFGLVHFHQGIGGMIGVGILGLVYGSFYLWSGRNLWVPILAHGLTGSTTLIVIYLSQL